MEGARGSASLAKGSARDTTEKCRATGQTKKKFCALLASFVCPCRNQMLYQSWILKIHDWIHDWICYLMTVPLMQIIFARFLKTLLAQGRGKSRSEVPSEFCCHVAQDLVQQSHYLPPQLIVRAFQGRCCHRLSVGNAQPHPSKNQGPKFHSGAPKVLQKVVDFFWKLFWCSLGCLCPLRIKKLS